MSTTNGVPIYSLRSTSNTSFEPAKWGTGLFEIQFDADLTGVDLDGTSQTIYSLINSNGSHVSVLTYGAIIQSIEVSDSKGNFGNIVLNYDNIESYIKDTSFIGATIGRYANRINDAKFTLDGHVYELDANDGSNSLHGGLEGFHTVVWTAKTSVNKSSATLRLG